MRCYCCNRVLSTQESTRKFVASGEYTEMCTPCLGTIDDDVPAEDSEFFVDEEGEDNVQN